MDDLTYREVLPVLFELVGVPDPDPPAPRLDPDIRQRQLVGCCAGSCSTAPRTRWR